MIVRKPYAFLIKYFKLIHIILFGLLGFSLFKFRSIYLFFKNYLATGTYIYTTNMASTYVGIFLIIINILLIGIYLMILLLMKQKKKPIIYYLSALIYSVVVFISLIVFTSIFTSLEYTTYSNQAVVLLRDLSMIIYYLDYIFLIIAFVRGFGFNIKKFNFDKDLKELDIADSDREEIEISSTIDYDKLGNFVRRKKRNFSYYIKENSYILTVFLVIILLSLTSYIAINKFIVNKTYKEGESISISNYEFTINNSYITNLDINNKVIKKNKKYVIVDFKVLNKNKDQMKLDLSLTKLEIDNKSYYPVTNDSFNDLGTAYKNQLLTTNEGSYLLIFEVEDNLDIKTINMLLGILKNKDSSSLEYKRVKLTPNVFEIKNLGEYKLNDVVEINNNFIKQEKLSITSSNVLTVDSYKYTKCNNQTDGECSSYDASVVPSIGKVLLKIEYSYKNQDIFKYASISYTKNDKTYVIKNNSIKIVTPSNYPENACYLEVSKEILNASNITLKFDIRGTSFNYEISE